MIDDRLVDSDLAIKGSIFPPEMVDVDKKEHPKYGLKYAKAIHESANKLGGHHFWNDEEYNTLQEIAQGRQSVDNLRKAFGFFRDPNEDPTDDGSTSLAFLDIQVLNLAPKYINRAVEKIMANAWDVQLEVIDPVSVHEKKTYEASLRAYYQFKGWIEDMGMSPRELFPDLDVDVLPEYPDELLYEMLINPKIKKAVDGEMGLMLLHEINNTYQKMRSATWDKVVFGRGHIHCFRDRNGVPKIEKLNPRRFVGSYVEDEDFDGQEYAGYYDFPTVTQFIKEAKGHLTDDQIQLIIDRWAFQNSMQTTYTPGRDTQNYDGLNYIPVLRFYFLSEDTRRVSIRKNQYGNEIISERSLKWKGPNAKEGEQEGKMTYTSVYGGTWILETELVYDYGRKELPRSNLVDLTLPIKTFAPTYKDGRTVSLVAQMIEPLNMINTAWNKIKEILAKGWMGFQEIDFTQLESVSLAKGGKNWTPRQVYKHFLQTGRLVKRSQVNRHDQRYSNSAVDSNPSGLQLSDYFTAFSTGIQMLEALTATTVAEAIDKPDRLAVGVMEQSQVTGDLDMGYLFNSNQHMYKAICKEMLLMLQQAKREGVGIEGFISALGKHFSVPDSIANVDYGIILRRAPTDQEWVDFYAELAIGLEKGTLTHLDTAFIREIKNLKKARQILGQRVKINERKAAQMMAQNNQAAIEANRVAAADKIQGELQRVEREAALKNEQIVLEGRIKELLLVREKELEGEITNRTDQIKERISKQTSVDELIKQAMRNRVEEKKVEKRPDKSPED